MVDDLLELAKGVFASYRAEPRTFDAMCLWMQEQAAKRGTQVRVTWEGAKSTGVIFHMVFADPIHQIVLKATIDV